MNKTIAIIPARGGSKRIFRKNIRHFLGKPIIAYSIEAAIRSGIFSHVMVSTEDEEIAAVAESYGAIVPFLRSNDTADDHSTTADVLEEVLTQYRLRGEVFDLGCCLYPTAPFVTAQNLKAAFDLLISCEAESVIPIVEFDYPIFRSLKVEDGKIGFVFPNFANTRSQDLPETYHDCGQFYFFNVASFFQHKTLFTGNCVPFNVPRTEVQDIDNEQDWQLAEQKFKLLYNQ